MHDDSQGGVPTDSPLRHLILLVQATGAGGQALPQIEGPRLPDWCGPQAGLPGKAYARVLAELWTEISPSGAYWNPTRALSDNRISDIRGVEHRRPEMTYGLPGLTPLSNNDKGG